MIDVLKELCQLDGPSGHEQDVRDYIINSLQTIPHVDSLKTDVLGNVLVHLQGEHCTERTILLAAHMDEVGLIATHITEDGFVRCSCVGGIDRSVLFGHRVRFKDRIGVVGGKAVHLCKGEEKNTLPDGDLLVDIGASSKDEALAVVSLGDTAVFDSDCYEIGSLIKGKALDDRAGCTILLELAKTKPPVDCWLAFTTQEEVGLRGAKTAAFQIQPDIAIVIDATTAADTVGVEAAKQVCCVGNGAVVSFMDRRTLYDAQLYNHIMQVAKENGISAQPKSVVAGGNDAGSIQTSGNGVRVAAISLPCRYIHSPSCMLSTEDMNSVIHLLHALLERSWP